ncbi:hypothetical protein ST47_g2216 [Ascochyta rabiei]|uniref:Uncharacterized protein n=1 Tax=Didymella rabiei TaxID=5454 RepID=A0A163JT68_DIDRA|nr:hypothetical protein ST47_g2216 [Ascochyta rabiei]
MPGATAPSATYRFLLMSDRLSIDNELATLRDRCYRGVVKVPLHTLDFNHPLVIDKHRKLSEQNVQRLERIFERNGCLRLQEENVINAIVHDDELPSLLSFSAATAEQLRQIAWARDAPTLDLGNLRCLSGFHRIEAAKRYLDENDKWWSQQDTPKPYLTRIIESFLNEQRPSDGEIFRKIRLYHRQKDEEAEERWWACLDKSKLRDLRQVLKKKELAAAFDSLIDMPGLWAKVQLGALQRLLALKCDEEMIAYLNHVKTTWNAILQCGDEVVAPSIVDAATVENLESLAPNHSDIDRDLVLAMMQQGELFPSQHNDEIRQTLLAPTVSKAKTAFVLMESKGTKPSVKGPNPVVWQCFAKFAISRGFITPRAKELLHDTCDSQLALDYLRKVNPLRTDFSAALVKKVVAVSRPEIDVNDEDLESDDSFIKLERRSGRPYELDLARDKKNLFLAHLVFGCFHLEPADVGSVIRSYKLHETEDDMDTDSSGNQDDDRASINTIHQRYKTLQNDYEAQSRTIQDAIGFQKTLQQELGTIRTEREQLKVQNSSLQGQLYALRQELETNRTESKQLEVQNSSLQEQLDTCLASSSTASQARIDKIVDLEYKHSKSQEMLAQAIGSWEDAVQRIKAAEGREAAALAEKDRYQMKALELKERVEQLSLPTSEPLLLTQSDTPQSTISNALTRNPSDLASMVRDLSSHYTWTGSNSNNIVFVAVSNADDGRPRGFECEISNDEIEVRAWDTRGKAISVSSTAYLFEALITNTVFFGPDLVFQKFLDERANEIRSPLPRKIRNVKRTRDPMAPPEDPKNYKTIVRKVPSQLSAINNSNNPLRLAEKPFHAGSRPDGTSDSESNQSTDENVSFRQRRVILE